MRLHRHIYNPNEGAGPWWLTGEWTLSATVGEERYLGTLLKGWWKLGAGSINRRFELEVALGGEDNMLQFGFVLPWLMRWHIGVRVPRSLTRAWVYQRREWAIQIGYIGHWLDLLFASDEHMRDTGMVSYYKAKRKRGETSHTTRAQEWPGFHLTVRPRILDWLLGRKSCETTEGEPEAALVPMPEGNYPGELRREERVWTRPRWPWPIHKRIDYWIDMKVGVPVPGKGENSWDCDDDAVFGTGGATRAEAIANVTRAALRDRSRYAGPNWTPTDGWPKQRVSAGRGRERGS